MTSNLDISEGVKNERTKKDIAKELLSIGLNPFPIKKGQKQPAFNWRDYQEQHVTIQEIEDWWSEPDLHDVGIITGKISGISVVDLDNKNGLSGTDMISKQNIKLPKHGLITQTKNGGFHVYLKYDERYPNTANVLKGVDIRNNGGVVVFSADGYSIVRGEINRDYFPKFFDAKLGKKEPYSQHRLESVPEPYRVYMNAVEGNRDNTMLKLFRSMAIDDLNVLDKQSIARTINSTFSPPLDENTLMRFMKRANGGDISEHVNGKKINLKSAMKSGSHVIDNKTEEKWLWEGFIPMQSTTLLAGYGGLGKSYSILDIAARITKGSTFPDGSKAPKGKVLYFGLEDPLYSDMNTRMEVVDIDPANISFLDKKSLPRTFNLTERDTREQVKDLIREEGAVLTIVDTISRAVGGLNDNDTNGVSEFMTQLDEIPSETNSALVIIKHFSKDGVSRGNAAHWVAGSSQWTDSARSTIICLPEITNNVWHQNRRIFHSQKFNRFGGGTYQFEFIPDANNSKKLNSIEWSERDSFNPAQHMQQTTIFEYDKCIEDIVEILNSGSKESNDLQKELLEKNYSEKTIRTAKNNGRRDNRFNFKRIEEKTYYHLPDQPITRDSYKGHMGKEGKEDVPKEPTLPSTDIEQLFSIGDEYEITKDIS